MFGIVFIYSRADRSLGREREKRCILVRRVAQQKYRKICLLRWACHALFKRKPLSRARPLAYLLVVEAMPAYCVSRTLLVHACFYMRKWWVCKGCENASSLKFPLTQK